VLLPRQQAKLARGTKDKEHAMSQTPNTAIAVIGIDIGKNSFHVVGHNARGAIVLQQLMQDRKPNSSTKTSCNARPDHTWGSKRRSTRPDRQCSL
jgi:hypothetical protein